MKTVAIYKADIYCQACGGKIAQARNSFVTIKDDSEYFPQFHMNSEADCPQHCGACHMFLENPLTDEGREYVRAQMELTPASATVLEWSRFYGIGDVL